MTRRYSLLDKIVYFLAALFLFAYYVSLLSGKNLFVEISFIVIGIISFCWFVTDKNFISINKMIAVFMMVFCSMAPLAQFEAGSTFWGIQGFEDSYYALANVLIIFFLAIYLFVYLVLSNKKKRESHQDYFANEPERILSNFNVFLLLFLSVLSFLFLLLTGRITSLEGGYHNSTVNSFVDTFVKIIRFFPVASYMIVVRYHQKGRTTLSRPAYFLISLFLLLLTILIFNPLSGQVGRYLILATYLAVISIHLKKSNYNSLLLLFVFVGFFLVLPSLNFFKYHSFSDIRLFTLQTVNFVENDYDAYYMFLSTIRYVENHGYSYGINILSAVFSFVPRSIWTWKSEPSGYVISLGNDSDFNNVSCPLFSEFYFASGIIGIIALTALFAFAIFKVEKYRDKNIFMFGVNAIIIGNILPLMRGAMLPMMSFIFALVVSFGIGCFVSRRGNRVYYGRLCQR